VAKGGNQNGGLPIGENSSFLPPNPCLTSLSLLLGAIIGIIFGVVALAIFVAVVFGMFVVRQRRRTNKLQVILDQELVTLSSPPASFFQRFKEPFFFFFFFFFFCQKRSLFVRVPLLTVSGPFKGGHQVWALLSFFSDHPLTLLLLRLLQTSVGRS